MYMYMYSIIGNINHWIVELNHQKIDLVIEFFSNSAEIVNERQKESIDNVKM